MIPTVGYGIAFVHWKGHAQYRNVVAGLGGPMFKTAVRNVHTCLGMKGAHKEKQRGKPE